MSNDELDEVVLKVGHDGFIDLDEFISFYTRRLGLVLLQATSTLFPGRRARVAQMGQQR
jgi:catechol 2,3-dioxygenase-like lactoylglutathione lyase family enzyme